MKKSIIASILIATLFLSSCSKNNEESSKTPLETTAITDISTDETIVNGVVPYTYKYKNYVYDDITLTMLDYTSFKMDEYDVTVSELELNEYIENILNKDTEYEHIESGVIKKNDLVNVSYEAFIDNIEYPSFSALNKNIYIDNESINPDFYSALIGKAISSEITFNMTVPENYSDKNICNKKMVIKLKINYINGTATVPTLTDGYVKKNTEFKNVNDFKEGLKKKIKEKNIQEKINSKSSLYYKAILESVKYSQDEKIEKIKNSYNLILKTINTSNDENVTDEGIKNYLVSMAIIKDKKIKISDKEKDEYLNTFAKNNGFKDLNDLYSQFKDVDKDTLNNYFLCRSFYPEKIMEKLWNYKIWVRKYFLYN